MIIAYDLYMQTFLQVPGYSDSIYRYKIQMIQNTLMFLHIKPNIRIGIWISLWYVQDHATQLFVLR